MLFDDLPPPVNAKETRPEGGGPPEVTAPGDPAPEADEPAAKRPRPAGDPGASGADDSDAPAVALARLTQHAHSCGSSNKFAKVVQLTSQLLEGGTLERRHNKAAFKARQATNQPCARVAVRETRVAACPDCVLLLPSWLQLLQALLSDHARVTAPEFRLECAALVKAACGADGLFNAKQKAALDVWAVTAVTCNALHTDDSYAFSAAVNDVKAAWSALPEYQPPSDRSAVAEASAPLPEGVDAEEAAAAAAMAAKMAAVEREAAAEAEALLDQRRDGLLLCVETAHSMYRWPWAQSIVDGLVDAVHAMASAKLSPQQRARLQCTHDAVKEARHRRRIGGGGGGGGGDMTSFERGQARFANAEISIRKQVGSSGVDGRGESCAHRLTQ